MNRRKVFACFAALICVLPAHGAVVAVNVTPGADGGYDLDGNGSEDFRMDSHSVGSLSIGSTTGVTYFEFQRGAGFSMAGRPTVFVPNLAALGAVENVGVHSEWGDAFPSWTPAIYAVFGGEDLMIGPGFSNDGFGGEFEGKTQALVGYRITKDGMDYFGVLELELRWLQRIRPDLSAMPPGPSFELTANRLPEPEIVLIGQPVTSAELWLGVRIKGGWMETEAGKAFAVSSVPEPQRVVLLMMSGVVLLLRRRRVALGVG